MVARRPYVEQESRHDLGRMDVVCHHCLAFHWLSESTVKTRRYQHPEFGTCCNSGKVTLPPPRHPPDTLHNLFEADDEQTRDFRTNIRAYNMALAFTSLGVTQDDTINRRFGGNSWVFRIQGQLTHLSGALEPQANTSPSYAQLYLYDPHVALQQRMNRNSHLREDTMSALQAMLTRYHQYAPVFKHAYEVLKDHPGGTNAEIRLRVEVAPGEHRRQNNLPTADEVAMILPGDGSANDYRDIILRARIPAGTNLCRIHEGHAAYDPLHYVLLFPFGENGWHNGLRQRDPQTQQYTATRLSETRYAAYQIHTRPGQYSTLIRGGRLFQQFLVDRWAATEQSRLRWHRFHQNETRASLFSGLEDAVATDGNVDLRQLGTRVILPSSFGGGPRHMQQRFQDAMAIARRFRKVDIFLTMTANPQWEEITRELLPRQTTYDRPDLVARVFELKRKALLDDIVKHGIFGRTVASVYTIEFQKRGLPHMHLLIFLDDAHSLRTPDDIDSCISAEWPDPETQPKLFSTVQRCMVHGPCGPLNPTAPCMENGRCTKFYPKGYQPFTRMDEDGYPLYRRREDDRKYAVGRHEVSNQWIVPYCPFLSAKYDCHINVECAVMLRSIKYPFKYIHKGSDRATIQVGDGDEINSYLQGRYIAASEAVWRLLHFSMHDQQPNVVRLQVHLPGQHLVRYNPDEDPQTVLERAATEKTTLTEFFAANQDPGPRGEEARQYTYQQFPEHFVWNSPKSPKSWSLRRAQQGISPTIGRMYFVSPSAGERFYLRTLLTIVKGPTSFEDLRRYGGVIYPTFRDACLARGLLEDDGEWRTCLQEAAVMQTGARLRQLFATLLLFCHPVSPEALWSDFRHHICDDLWHRLRVAGHTNPMDEDVYDYGLYLLDNVLHQSGQSLKNFPTMPQWAQDWVNLADNPLIADQLNYNRDAERTQAQTRIRQLNNDQRVAFLRILESVEKEMGHTFFLDGPGGTGKTFVYNTLCNRVRSEGWIVLCVASSGIAALLMPGGRTAHSQFKIPIDGLSEESVCSIPKESNLAGLLRVTRLILWDEALMQHRYTHEALDRTLRDIRNSDQPFGGITVVFGGDFQQTLPVVPKGTQQEIVDASLPRSYLWKVIHIGGVEDRILRLRQNMRLDAGEEEAEFAAWLLDIGHGRNIQDDGKIDIPGDMQCADLKSLIDFVYPGIDGITPPPEYFLDRSILAARNGDVDGLNETILERMDGEKKSYISADSIENEDGSQAERANEIPVEFLRTLDAPGLPPGDLALKFGCPIILLRNIAPGRGLCNGTRCILRRASERVLEIQIIGGQFNGEIAFVPRITLTPSGKNAEFSFTLRRRQFPIRLAFAMTINKAQGQSVRYVGLDLRVPVFSHGQLYVALSRATSCHRIKALLPDEDRRTINIVYPEVIPPSQ